MVRTKTAEKAKALAKEAVDKGFDFPSAKELGVKNIPELKNKEGKVIQDRVDAPDCVGFNSDIQGIDWTEYPPSEIVNVLLQHPCINHTLKGVCSRHDCKQMVVKFMKVQRWNEHLDKLRNCNNFPMISRHADILREEMATSYAEEIVAMNLDASVKFKQSQVETSVKLVGALKASASHYKDAKEKVKSAFNAITDEEHETLSELMGSGSKSSKSSKQKLISGASSSGSGTCDSNDDVRQLKAELERAKLSEQQLQDALNAENQKNSELALKLAEKDYEVSETRQKLVDARLIANEKAIDSGDMEEPFPVLNSQPVDYDDDYEMPDTKFDIE